MVWFAPYIYAQDTNTFVVSAVNEQSVPLTSITVLIDSKPYFFNSPDGLYTLTIQENISKISLLVEGYQPINVFRRNLSSISVNQLTFALKSVELDYVQVTEDRQREASITRIEPLHLRVMPSAFGDFNKILAVLPGVVSNNELSSTYAVRGGNYDENLVYVNGFEIYRPQILRSGQQEGLSFVNPNLAQKVDFSTGGWKAIYGDKLSSVMNVQYKNPQRWGGSLQAGFLGGSTHLEGVSRDKRWSFVSGLRYKDSRYLLATTPTEGTYLPRFFDLQSAIAINLTRKSRIEKEPRRSFINILWSYANNRFLTMPTTQNTRFGSATEILSLTVGFYGAESMKYDTHQGGIRFSQFWLRRIRTDLYLSGARSMEREYADIEAGYSLCELLHDPDNPDPNECSAIRGLGTQYFYARNALDATLLSVENRNAIQLSPSSTFDVGARVEKNVFDDRLQEYSFTDSVDYVSVTSTLNSKSTLMNNKFSFYGMYSLVPDSVHQFSVGFRWIYASLSNTWLPAPSLQYSVKPPGFRNTLFKVSTGVYHQPPYYRELRNFAGVINTSLRSQSAFHAVLGTECRLSFWNRPFYFTWENYYKYMWNVVPYDYDNIRIRYYASNDARAYALGTEARLSGEFIKGEESWFSIGVMSVRENLGFSNQGWVRRPTDQRLTFAIFFQDHVPKIPALKLYIHAIYGSGFPFGVPNVVDKRNIFQMPSYRRIDIGTAYVLSVKDRSVQSKSWYQYISLGLEILNVLGVNNTFSYIWIADFNARRYAVPQTLSQRFVNLKLSCVF